MAGELSFLTTLEVVVVAVEEVEDVLVVLIWSATSVVSQVILLVNAVCAVVQEDVVAAAPLDIAEVPVTVAGDVIDKRFLNVTYYFIFFKFCVLNRECWFSGFKVMISIFL